ncbi:MAG: endonuclease domain-containing protein [Candidatus Margulisiibacteriota bacterium]|jgi:leucyl-tRNA synthetase
MNPHKKRELAQNMQCGFSTKEIVRYLRKNHTHFEKILWTVLRNRKLNNYKFIRQYPIIVKINGQEINFVADFYCAKKKLIIELDGKIHEKQKEYDQYRTVLLKTKGYTIIRFENELIENNLENVLRNIKKNL